MDELVRVSHDLEFAERHLREAISSVGVSDIGKVRLLGQLKKLVDLRGEIKAITVTIGRSK